MTLGRLIEGCKLGNAIAQRQLYDAYYKRFYAIAWRYMRSDVEVEDVLSTAFTNIFKNINTFQYINDVATEAWMKTIVVKACLHALRLNNSCYEKGMEQHDQTPIEENTIAHLSYKDLLNCIQLLPIGYRTVFNLYEIEGYSHKDIGRMLNISEQTSKSQLYKSKKQLQTIIKNRFKEVVK
jgi:RNA polymerase sigma factor (sigma-70 family)